MMVLVTSCTSERDNAGMSFSLMFQVAEPTVERGVSVGGSHEVSEVKETGRLYL